MYYYGISSGSYGEYEEIIIFHEKKFEQQEFDTLVKEAMIVAIDRNVDLDDAIDYVIDYLVKNHKFSRPCMEVVSHINRKGKIEENYFDSYEPEYSKWKDL